MINNYSRLKKASDIPPQCRYAEELCIKAPLQAHPNPSVNFTEKVMSALRLPNPMVEDVSHKPKDFYTCTFKKSKFHMFLGANDPDNFFRSVEWGRVTTARKHARTQASKQARKHAHTHTQQTHTRALKDRPKDKS